MAVLLVRDQGANIARRSAGAAGLIGERSESDRTIKISTARGALVLYSINSIARCSI
jgi:hypothetical protein